MPPTRTQKKNVTAQGGVARPKANGAAMASAPSRARRVAPKAAKPKKGFKAVEFLGLDNWEKSYEEWIGTATKVVSLGRLFKLTDEHINAILALGAKVCAGLTEFKFTYHTAHNDAEGVTDEAITALAKRCPKLKKICLPGTCDLGDALLLSLLEHCPDLTDLELTAMSKRNNNITAAAFETLQQNPDWAPKLKKLRLADPRGGDGTKFMKATRALSAKRLTLAVELAGQDVGGEEEEEEEEEEVGALGSGDGERIFKKGEDWERKKPRVLGYGGVPPELW